MQSLMTRLLLGGGGGFSPSALFSSGEQGAWYDPSDLTTLFQDSAGTTPATAVEQPVGLVLDKSKGLVLGSELITPVANQDFSSDTGYWTKGVGVTISGGAANFSAASGYALYRGGVLPTGAPGAYYEVTFTVTNYVSGSIRPYFGVSPTFGTAVSANGTYTQRFCPTSGGEVGFNANVAFTGSIDNVSIKQVSGNHAYQTTSASRPTLRARYNLLTYSEQFDNAAWTKTGSTVSANSAAAPDGTTTADTLTQDTSTGVHEVAINPSLSGGVYSGSVYVKPNGTTRVALLLDNAGGLYTAYFDITAGTSGSVTGTPNTGTASISAIGNGWFRIVITGQTLIAPRCFVRLCQGSTNTVSFTGDGTSGIFIWGAQLTQTAVFPSNTYQRIAAATDYATGAAFPPYLFFDGVDDSLLTNSVDFSATDKMTVWAGVTKSSDAATGTVVQLSSSTSTNNGVFGLFAPFNTGASADYAWQSKGTTRITVNSGVLTGPDTSVFAGIGDVSAPLATLRRNAVQAATSAGSQGTGNFGNFALSVGAGAGPLNGNIYSLIIRGAATASPQLISTEQWVAQKTGITIP